MPVGGTVCGLFLSATRQLGSQNSRSRLLERKGSCRSLESLLHGTVVEDPAAGSRCPQSRAEGRTCALTCPCNSQGSCLPASVLEVVLAAAATAVLAQAVAVVEAKVGSGGLPKIPCRRWYCSKPRQSQKQSFLSSRHLQKEIGVHHRHYTRQHWCGCCQYDTLRRHLQCYRGLGRFNGQDCLSRSKSNLYTFGPFPFHLSDDAS